MFHGLLLTLSAALAGPTGPNPVLVDLIDDINALRTSVANGTSGLPIATDMNQLMWDPALAESARQHVERCVWGVDPNRATTLQALASSASFVVPTSGTTAVGQSIYFRNPSGNARVGEFAVDAWEAEGAGYSFGTVNGQAPNFTQLIWADTRYIGCAMATCPNLLGSPGNADFIACNYFPAGNFFGQFPYQTSNTCDADRTAELDGLCAGCPDPSFNATGSTTPASSCTIHPLECTTTADCAVLDTCTDGDDSFEHTCVSNRCELTPVTCTSGSCALGTCSTACPDGDGDGVCDVDDVCVGDDASGDVDADGLCNDSDTDCSLAEFSLGSAIGALGVIGDTCGAGDDHEPTISCERRGAGTGEEIVASWIAPFSGQFAFSTASPGTGSFDTTLYVTRGSDLQCHTAVCDDDYPGSLQSSVVFDVNAGEELLLFLDGFAAECGDVQLTIVPTSQGVLTLDTPLAAGATARWTLLGAVPDANMRLYFSRRNAVAGNPTPFPGGPSTTLPFPKGVLQTRVPAEGTFTMQALAPTNLPSNFVFEFQAVYWDGASGGVSNEVSTITQ